jgi:cardiolipin synthase
MNDSKYTIYSKTSQAWDAMYAELEKAKKSIYLELYIFIDDEAGHRFFELLSKKAKSGLDVKVIIDYVGSFGISKILIKQLTDSGVDLHIFNERKRRYRGLWKKIITRTHRKILIIDEMVGFIGGVNIYNAAKDWLDIQLKIEGKVVRSLLRAFAKMYVICGGRKEKVKHLLKYKFRVEQEMVDFIYDEANQNKSFVKRKYIEAFLKARERIILFSPYYFPDKSFLYALWQARKRGVKVDLLLPLRADVRTATYASYAWFSLLKKLGVNIHLSNKMMHGKGVVVDDEWAMVGSSNIDQTSFHDNYEANVKIKDKKFVKNIKNIIQEWINNSKKLSDLNWGKRGIIHRFFEWFSLKAYDLWHNNTKDSGLKSFRLYRKK